MKKTKIVATIGPASAEKSTLIQLIGVGVNFFRFNLKYNTVDWHNQTIRLIRQLSNSVKTRVGIMIDIPSSDFKIEIDDFDVVALSYLKSSEEIEILRTRLNKQNINAKIVAKFENQKALDDMDQIIESSDGIMVARGDLGKEIPLKELAMTQKKLIDSARINEKSVIVATQMLLSMTENIQPTRAEATDVANAVWDGADALMLSEETAIGKYPIESARMMAEIVEYNENVSDVRKVVFLNNTLNDDFFGSVADICMKGKVDKIVVLTKSGNSSRKLAKYRLNTGVIAVSDDERVLNCLCLSYGQIPYIKKVVSSKFTTEEIVSELTKAKMVTQGQSLLVIHGNNWFDSGTTNQIILFTV